MRRLEQILETYAWYQGVGNQVEETALARYVHNAEHPDIWVANHLSGVRASSASEIQQVFRRADDLFAHCSHRMAIVDSLTPDSFVARLAFEDFIELTPTLQMVLDGPLAVVEPRSSSRPVELRPVVSEGDWDLLYSLVRANHVEGESSHRLDLEEQVTRRIHAGYRAKSRVSQFFLALVEGMPCAYGSAIVGPYDLGIVEDLFTLPGSRRTGLATALIVHAVEYARARGMGPMLIGPHVAKEPKALYAALGFVPQCVTRQYLRE